MTNWIDGIYFDLPADEYHKIKRLSNSGICKMLISPATFWANSWLNPNHKDETTPQMLFGRAAHTSVLEPEKFDDELVQVIDWNDPQYEGCLMGNTEVQAALADLGMPKTKAGEKVLDRAVRLQSYGYEGQISYIVEDQWEKDRGNRIAVSVEAYQMLKTQVELAHNTPDIKSKLTGGESEVTILWTDPETGTKMKARLDYLKPELITDYKTFSNPSGKELNHCLVDAFMYGRHYIQARLYWQAVELIRSGHLKIIHHYVDEDQATTIVDPDKAIFPENHIELIKKITAQETPLKSWYVYQESGGVPNLVAREVRMTTVDGNEQIANAPDGTKSNVARLAMRNQLNVKADNEISFAMKRFLGSMEIWGKDTPWQAWETVSNMDDDDFRTYWLENY